MCTRKHLFFIQQLMKTLKQILQQKAHLQFRDVTTYLEYLSICRFAGASVRRSVILSLFGLLLEIPQRRPAFGRRLTSYSRFSIFIYLSYPVSTPKLMRREYHMCLFHGFDSQLRERMERMSQN